MPGRLRDRSLTRKRPTRSPLGAGWKGAGRCSVAHQCNRFLWLRFVLCRYTFCPDTSVRKFAISHVCYVWYVSVCAQVSSSIGCADIFVHIRSLRAVRRFWDQLLAAWQPGVSEEGGVCMCLLVLGVSLSMKLTCAGLLVWKKKSMCDLRCLWVGTLEQRTGALDLTRRLLGAQSIGLG